MIPSKRLRGPRSLAAWPWLWHRCCLCSSWVTMWCQPGRGGWLEHMVGKCGKIWDIYGNYGEFPWFHQWTYRKIGGHQGMYRDFMGIWWDMGKCRGKISRDDNGIIWNPAGWHGNIWAKKTTSHLFYAMGILMHFTYITWSMVIKGFI